MNFFFITYEEEDEEEARKAREHNEFSSHNLSQSSQN
jgi:hypothetical protein